MKKILLSLLALGCFSAANAQTFRFGPTVGGNLNISDETKTKIGFAVGAKAEMNFNNPENGWFMDASACSTTETDRAKTISTTKQSWVSTGSTQPILFSFQSM